MLRKRKRRYKSHIIFRGDKQDKMIVLTGGSEMECINGEWVMTGCALDDPNRLKSLDELICLVKRIGFLPLFSNSIPDFLWKSE